MYETEAECMQRRINTLKVQFETLDSELELLKVRFDMHYHHARELQMGTDTPSILRPVDRKQDL